MDDEFLHRESIMFISSLRACLIVLLPALFLQGCSYYRSLHQPLRPQDERIAYLWPILNETEKSEISRLDSVREVDAFIARFWAAQDPTPGTPANELQAEYDSRVAYVRAVYPIRRGWQLGDQARVYLVYGPPDDIYREPWTFSLYPGPEIEAVEIWVYNIPASGDNFFGFMEDFDPGAMKFCFADFSGLGYYTQVYSNLPGEGISPAVGRLLSVSTDIEGDPLHKLWSSVKLRLQK